MNTAGLKNITVPLKRSALVAAVGLALLAGNVQAQQPPAAGEDSTLVKLIRSLVDSGALEPEAGQLLMEEARRDGAVAATPTPAPVQTQPGDVRVPYIPQTVRDEIREEVKAEVLAQAKDERWAAPEAVPEWSQRIRVEGDVRVRNESRLFSDRNDITQVDWSAINDSSGFDVNGNTNLALPPLRNTRQDRTNSWRIRARLGIVANLGEQIQAGVRIGSGNDDGPVSATQTLGSGKSDAWIDQAWIAWAPTDWLRAVGGRFDNPYWSSETLFSNDLNFDGLALQYADKFAGEKLSLFATMGLTPLEYSSDSFPSTSTDKAESRDKWLNGLQLGAEWAFNDAHRLRGAVAYYDFRRITGELSQPCALYSGEDHCSGDWSRPVFMQKGNTLMLLRDIALDPLDPANTPLPQYVGLASEFELVDVNLRWTLPAFAGYSLQLDGHWIRNLAYDPQEMWTRAAGGIVTNLSAPVDGTPSAADIDSGDTAWQAQATFGRPKLKDIGDWNLWLGYRRVEPDALPDAYNDSDFHLGGTNAKGYFLGASWLFNQRTSLNGSWFSAKEVFGAPQSIDLFQLEVNARF